MTYIPNRKRTSIGVYDGEKNHLVTDFVVMDSVEEDHAMVIIDINSIPMEAIEKRIVNNGPE